MKYFREDAFEEGRETEEVSENHLAEEQVQEEKEVEEVVMLNALLENQRSECQTAVLGENQSEKELFVSFF